MGWYNDNNNRGNSYDNRYDRNSDNRGFAKHNASDKNDNVRGRDGSGRGFSNKSFQGYNKADELHAPYNFIEFADTVIERYSDVDELPKHNCIATDLKTGEIHYTFTAKTPVFVGGETEAPHAGQKEGIKTQHFYKNIAGNYEIPGSTVRGLIRENVHILGYGLIRDGEDIEDERFFYRNVAGNNKPLKTEYSNILGLNRGMGRQNVKAGYIECRRGEYYITAAKDGFCKIKRDNPSLIKMYGDIPYAETKDVYYIDRNGDGIAEDVTDKPKEKPYKQGLLISTGKPIKLTAPHCLYIFSPKGHKGEFKVPKDDIDKYKVDFKFREKALKNIRNDGDISFWELPKDGEKCKPVFYVEHNGHISIGMTLYLRVLGKQSVEDGLPLIHKELNASDKEVIDYVYSMFGFTGDDFSYKSRLSFLGAEADGKVEEMPGVTLIPGQPRASYYPIYLKRDGEHNENYFDDEIELRGYKQYWYGAEKVPEIDQKNEKLPTIIKPLPKETVFHGTVKFTNLSEDELGLLLWALQLDNGCYQGIGKGKPFGYGCVSVKIDSLSELDAGKLYGSSTLTDNPYNDTTGKIVDYIERYKKYVSDIIKTGRTVSIDDEDRIKDFMYMHRIFGANYIDTSYMPPEQYGKGKEKIFKTVKEYRERKK